MLQYAGSKLRSRMSLSTGGGRRKSSEIPRYHSNQYRYGTGYKVYNTVSSSPPRPRVLPWSTALEGPWTIDSTRGQSPEGGLERSGSHDEHGRCSRGSFWAGSRRYVSMAPCALLPSLT